MKLIMTEGANGSYWCTNSIENPREVLQVDQEKFNKLKLKAPASTDDHPIYIECYTDTRYHAGEFCRITSRFRFRYRTLVNGIIFVSENRESINIPDELFDKLTRDRVIMLSNYERSEISQTDSGTGKQNARAV